MSASITVIFNQGSGHDRKEETREEILRRIESTGRPITIIDLGKHSRSEHECNDAVKKAKSSDGIVVAAGGDGTVNTVAMLCHRHEVPLGIIPLGTFNYFARDLHIPLELDAAVEVVLGGSLKKVSAGFIHDRIFLNNASFGLYTTIIRKREQDKSRFGRYKIIAILSAIQCLFRPHRPLSIRIGTDENIVHRKTDMVFVGNNTAQLENLGLKVADCTRENKLAVIITKPLRRMQTGHLLIWGTLKNLTRDSLLEEFCAEEFEVELNRPSLDVAIDGEIVRLPTPFQFTIKKAALSVLVPKEIPAA